LVDEIKIVIIDKSNKLIRSIIIELLLGFHNNNILTAVEENVLHHVQVSKLIRSFIINYFRYFFD